MRLDRLPRGWTLLLLGLLALSPGAEVAAQEPARGELRLSRGPYYVDVPITLELSVTGMNGPEEPQVEPGPLPAGATLTGPSYSRNSMRTVRTGPDGRLVSQSRITWTMRYQFSAPAEGKVRIPDFRVTQGSNATTVSGAVIPLSVIPVSDQVGVEVVLPERAIYPGQRVPIEVRMQFRTELANTNVEYALRVPFSALEPRFSFVDAELARGDKGLRIETGSGTVELKRETRSQQGSDRGWTWLVAERELVPLRAGTFELPASTLLWVNGKRWRRTMFGREATETELLLAKGVPRSIEVRPIPEQGRPASFAGAVGRGFTIGVEVDRSVVRTGDPFQLTFRLQGDGNLAAAGLPDLYGAGLPERGFSYSGGSPPGLLEEGGKVFSVTVRPTDPAVNALPPLEYSWFDPETASFRTTRTAPIALAVEAGEVVGAEAVVGGPEPGEGAEREEAPVRAGGARPRFVLDGADLSLEKSAARLAIAESDRFGGATARGGLILLGLLSLLAAFGSRVRDRVPPEVRARRQRLARLAGEVEAAATNPGPDGARALVGALRAMAREVRQGGGGSVEGLEEFIRISEEGIYAPDGETRGDEERGRRARELARQLEEAGR